MVIKIKYRFKDESRHYTCVVSYQQYLNFRNVPIIAECSVVEKSQALTQENLDAIQKALDKAFENNTSHIKKLSS